MASQGVQLPISLQIENLQEIAAQLKKFSETNILSDSIGGKKINAELSKVLSTLAQIEVKSKSAFKSGGDFTGLDKSISKVELGLDHIQSIIGSLTFKDLKIPDSTATQMAELNARVNELKAGLATFKQAQMDKLSTNGSFLIDLEKAFPKKSAQLLAQDYDTLYQTVKEGMAKINGEVAKQSAKLQASQQQVTENMSGKANFTALGALDWLKEAFKAIPKNGKMTDLQKLLESKYMNMETLADGSKQFTGFKAGGYTGFMTLLQKQFELTPDQMADMEARIREATALVARKAKTTTFETLRKMSTDNNYGAQVLTGQAYDAVKKSSDEYVAQKTSAASEETKFNSLHSQMESMTSVWNALQGIQTDVAAKSAEVAAALAAPQGELDGLRASIMNVVQSSPELSKAFKDANTQISRLKTVSEVGRQQLTNLDQTLNKLNGVSNFITRYAGIYAIVRRVSTAVRNAFNNIKELDKSITNIAVVTNMSQEDLWGKIGEYTQMAQQYGVATKDVYTVSQIFYQQGLQTNQVMALTTETLKMAKISGMEYGTAANAMTVAIRAFKIEMTDAQQVTDTYSALAAKFAVSSAEIANAMEKTASSAANVGMTLQSTSAFISVMEQTTRESAQNIGSALKSIISRYGEMKASPSKLLEVDGEEVAFNKVDTALKSVGISIKDSAGQFRDFDDVILELSSKWDTLDNNTQRYIATIMAGNRQQSRFIALVSNYDELKRAMQVANDSENASIVQVGKTMDSLETKAQKLKNAFAQIYLDLHVENGLKSMYDSLTQILKTVGKLGMFKGVIPSLLNILGFGSGLKGIVTGAKGYIQNRKSQVNIDMSKAQAEAAAINATLAKKIYKEIELNVTNKGELEALLAQQNAGTGTGQTPTGTQPVSGSMGIIPTVMPMPGASPEKPVTDDQGASGALSGVAGAAGGAQGPITGLGAATAGASGALQGATGPITALGAGAESSSTALTTLGSGVDSAVTGVQALGPAVQNAADSANAAAAQMQQYAATNLPPLHFAGMTYSQLNGITGGMSGASIGLFSMLPGLMPGNQNPNWREWFPGGQPKGQIGAGGYRVERGNYQAGAREVVGYDDTGKPIYGGYGILPREVPPSARDAGQNPEELDENKFSWKNNKWGNGQGFKNARAWASAGAIIAQLAGTAIAAAGAARKDKVGETLGGWGGINGNGVETSKLLTGLGNGLSMGGTGARIGMMFGPWGAAIGGALGFIAGGLPSILDGLDQTLKERITLLKEESEQAKEESLKKEAKTSDLSSSIDNLKTLRKAMYNSADDMQAYKEAMNNMAASYPELISSYDEAGNAIIDLQAAESLLAQTRLESVNAAREANIAQGNLVASQLKAVEELRTSIKETEEGSDQVSHGAAGAHASGGWHIRRGYDTEETLEIKASEGEYSTYGINSEVNYKETVSAILAAMDDAARAQAGITATNIEELTHGELINLLTYGEANWRKGSTYYPYYEINGKRVNFDKMTGGDWNRWVEPFITTDETGGTDVGKTQFRYKGEADKLSNIIAEYASIQELFDGKESIYDTEFGADWDKELGPTWEQLQTALTKVEEKIKMYERKVAGIEEQSGLSISQSRLYNTALVTDALSNTDVNSLQSHGVYGQLFNQILQTKVPSGYKNILDWQNKGGDTFTTDTQLYANEFINWYESLTTVQRELLESMDFTEYSSPEEILSKFGITAQNNEDLYNAFITQFIESNKNNRKRILDLIYTSHTDTNGDQFYTRVLNSEMKGLAKFTDNAGRNQAIHIGTLFEEQADGSSKIISKYSDYFATQLISINSLAEQGYTELAGRRLNALSLFSDALSSITDASVQNDLYSTITQIDFSSYKSIIEAYTAIEEYGKKNNKQAEVAPLLTELSLAQSQLVFNVNTLASELTTQIETAAKDIDDILTANKSGLTLDKAIESFKKISSAFSEITSFDQVFKYDAILGKYVYTTDGLQKAIETKEKELATQAEQLSDTAKIYTTKLTEEGSDKAVFRQAQYKTSSVIKDTMASFSSMTDDSEAMLKKYESRADLEAELTKQGFDIEEAGIKEILDAQEAAGKFSFAGVRNTYVGMHKNNVYGYASEIMDQVKTFVGADSELIPYYEQLAKGFMDSKDEQYATKTWDVFLTYLEDEAQSNSDKAKDAESLLNEYRANKKNQLYSAVDWNKLATGSDFTGTNQKLIDSLALELNDFSYETTDENDKIVRKYREGVSYTWQQVREAYLDQLYGSLDSLDAEIEAAVQAGDKDKEADARNRKAARQAADAASKGAQSKARSDQIATAITEVLEGGGKALSDTTIALLKESDEIDLKATGGVLDAGQDYVAAARALYQKNKDNLLTLAERNKSYGELITAHYKKQKAGDTLLSAGSQLDFSNIESAFTDMGLQLDEYFDEGTGKWKEDKFKKLGLLSSKVFSTDIFGKTTIVDWKSFITFLKGVGIEYNKLSYAAQEKYRRAYIDSLISNANDLDLDKAASSQISALSGAKVGDRIQISAIKNFIGETEDYILVTSEEQIAGYMDMLENTLRTEDLDVQQSAAIRSALATWKTKFNQNEAWYSVIGEKTTYAAAQSLQEALGRTKEDTDNFMSELGFYWDSYTKQFIAGDNAVEKLRAELAKTPTTNVEAANNLQALIDNLEDTQKYKPMKALQDVLTNSTDITNEQIAAFNTAFEGIDLRHFVTKDITGKQKLNITMLQGAMQELGYNINDLFGEEIASIVDENMKSVSEAVEMLTTGTTEVATMQKFLKNYRELTGRTLAQGDAFQYNDILDAWTINPDVLIEYATAQAQDLVNLGILSAQEVDKYVNDNVQKKLAEAVDVSAFLEAENKQGRSRAKLAQQMKAAGIGFGTESEKWEDYLTDKIREEAIMADMSAEELAKIYADKAKENNKLVQDANIDTLITQLEKGGAAAVDIMKAVADANDVDLSASDVEAAYRAEVKGLEDALDQLVYSPGALISGTAVKIFEKLQKQHKASITKLGDGSSAVITSVTDIAAAYEEYYKMLAESGEATLAALNEAKAKVLETQNGKDKEQHAIDALGDAAGMTYTTFAAIFTDAGVELTDEIMKQLTTSGIIEAMGGNKMRIKDFAKFAQAMNWDTDSEEYLSAFKSYNDGLIELNRKTEKSITEEITALKGAKPGDWLNLTDFAASYYKALAQSINANDYMKQAESEVGANSVEARYVAEAYAADAKKFNESIFTTLNKQLLVYGAYLQDGILKLTKNANLLGVVKTLKDASITTSMDLQGGFEEISDTISEILKGYAEAIQKGIEGGLTQVEKADLISKALDLGLKKIDFTEAIDGAKLAESSAIALYVALKRVDAAAASLTFDALKSSLEEANENFKSVSSLTAYLKSTMAQINSADKNVSDARLQQYQAELAVAQEILAVRSTQEDSSFNFMSNDIPAAQKNPLNYAKNWTEAFQKIRDAFKVKKGGKTGFIDYEDWYNIVTEMNNIAALGGPIKLGALELDGSLEAASKAIQAGCDALTTVDTGDLKVNLGSIGIDIQSGAEAMSQSVTNGIQAAAHSQVQMLDGLIAMLEIIVAMEQLGDITGDDTSIDLGDIFVTTGEAEAEANYDTITKFTDKFEKARKKLIEYLASNEDAKKMFEHTRMSLGGEQRSMYDMLSLDFKTLFPDKLTGPQRKAAMDAFQGMLNSMYQAAISGDYDLNDIAASVQNIMQQTGVDLSNFVFEFTNDAGEVTRVLTFVGNTMVDIDFSNEDTRKAFDDYFGTKYAKDEAGFRDEIQGLIKQYQTGKENDTLDFEDLINIRTKVGVAANEFVLNLDSNGVYTGYYGNQQFKGASKEDLLNYMAEAALLKDEGFDFKLERDATTEYVTGIQGTTLIGGVEINVDFDKSKGGKNKAKYTYTDKNGKDHTSYSKEDIMYYLAQDGEVEGLDAGTYSINIGDKKYSIEVKEHAELGFKYSVETDADGKPVFKYNGQKFNDYKSMYEYMGLMKAYDETGAKSHIEDIKVDGKKAKKNTVIVNEQAGAKVIITFDEDGMIGKPQYEIGGQTIPGDNAKAVFDAITGVLDKDGAFLEDNPSFDAGSKVKAAYYHMGQRIDVSIDVDTGNVEYSWTPDGGEGNPITGNDPAFIEAAILAQTGLKDSTQEKYVKMTIGTTADVKFIIKNGKVQIDESQTFNNEADAALAEEMRQKLEAQLSEQTLENPVEATANKVVIKIGDAAEITTDVQTVEVAEIPEATGTVKTLKVKAQNTEAEGTITDAEITAMLDGATVDVTIDKDKAVKELEEIKTKAGEVESSDPTVTVTAETATAKSQLDTIIGLLSQIQSKTIEVHTKYTEEGTPPSTGDGGGDTGGGCFMAGTQIIMANHTMKSIEDIQIGEQVIAYNDENGQFEVRTVNKSYAHYNTPRVLDIVLSNGIILGITPGHPILTPQGWKSRDIANSRWEHNTEADWLNIGDEVIGYFGNARVLTIKEHPIPANYVTYNIEVETCHTFLADGIVVHNAKAVGNVGFAGGNAQARGTLMGELGPELVVSKGRYFVVGQNGPEMVDLADDAIVFNHLQTKSLLEKGTSSTRGRAITNEYNAVAYATGSRNGGPAMSSAAAALAALKQLRAQWQALEKLSAKDLAGKGGGGGGGGAKNAAFIKELERWYNLLQDIATLEQKITYEQQKRTKITSDFIRSGQEYHNSLKDNLKYLEQEVSKHQELADAQQKYFNQRREELNAQSAFSSLYTFDENGQIKYDPDKFVELSNRFGGDSTTGKPNYTVKEQYDWLKAQGYGYAMEYNENGEKIEIKDANDEAGMKSAIEAFWAKIDADKGEMQELHDSIEEHKNAVLEKQEAQNEILHEIEDNQLAVEQKVLNAIEDAAKREIDELQDQKDAIQKSNEAMVKGLTDQLNKERQMYQTQQSESDLATKRRRLAILQRSGGSASEINSLQKEIDESSRDLYFTKQQEQIDAIQQASENELEKLQNQIDLMNESLEYQKENGLLWAQVYDVMSRNPQDIADFIQQNDSAYWGKSPADLAKSMRDDLFEAEKWRAFAQEGVDIKDYVSKIAGEIVKEDDKTKKDNENGNGNNNNNNNNGNNGNGNGNGNGNATNNPNKKNNGAGKKYKVGDKIFDTKAEADKYLELSKTAARQGVGMTVKTYNEGYATQEQVNAAKRNQEKINSQKVEEAKSRTWYYFNGKKYESYSAANSAKNAALKAAKTAEEKKKVGNVTSKIEYYATGGYDYTTGLAMLHGTSSRPEAILNAEQTKVLRENILGHRPDSLVNLLQAYNEAYHGLSSSEYESIADNSNSIVFEHAEVNVKVDKLANDYDAARAGDNIMKEMLNIARKTSASNRIGGK